MRYFFLIVVLFLAISETPLRAQDTLPYKNPRLSTETRVADLLSRMTLEEKFWQL